MYHTRSDMVLDKLDAGSWRELAMHRCCKDSVVLIKKTFDL
jgi:hypothetical protein